MAGSTDWAGTSEKRRALQTELCLRRVLRLAPGTLHTGASQRAGAGTGRTGGASLVWRAGGVKDAKERPGPLRARLHLSLRGYENWVLWLKRFPRSAIGPSFWGWRVGDFQNRPAFPAGTAGRSCRVTDSGTGLPAGGSATGVREEHRTENPASAPTDESAWCALVSADVHGCHQDCHHWASSGDVRAVREGAGWLWPKVASWPT
jgi:hypothetical protein